MERRSHDTDGQQIACMRRTADDELVALGEERLDHTCERGEGTGVEANNKGGKGRLEKNGR